MNIESFASIYRQKVTHDDGEDTVHGKWGEVYVYDDRGTMAAFIKPVDSNEWWIVRRRLTRLGAKVVLDAEDHGVIAFKSSDAQLVMAILYVIEPGIGPAHRPLPKGLFTRLF